MIFGPGSLRRPGGTEAAMPGQVQWLIGAVTAVAVLAAVLRLRGAARRRRPYRGDLWWADVPFTDGSGGKVRPCLVLLRHADGIVVLKITSQDKSHRRDHVVIPTRAWDRRAGHDSYLNLGEPVVLAASAFKRRAGACDRAVLRRVAAEQRLSPRNLLTVAARPARPRGRNRRG
jgi:hypothetical protein